MAKKRRKYQYLEKQDIDLFRDAFQVFLLAMDSFRCPAVMVGPSLNLYYMNRRFSEFVEGDAPVKVEDSVLVLAADEDMRGVTEGLKAIVEKAINLSNQGEWSPLDFILPHRNDRANYMLRIQGLTSIFKGDEPPHYAAMVFFMQFEGENSLSPALLHDLLGCSKREAEICIALTDTASIEEIAVRLGIDVATVEAALAKIFTKTGCRGVTELVAILNQLRSVN